MVNETLEAIRRSAAIPSMPLVATRCFEMTQDPNCSYDKLSELLSTDPGIASEILRLSNSALFGVTREVTSLRQAMALLGVRRIRDLVLTRYLVQRLEQLGSSAVDLNYFWRRSLTTAVVGSRFAEALAPRHRDEAFVGGLLADIGVVVLAKALPTSYGTIAKQYAPMYPDDWMQAEQTLLGVSHGEVSAMILEEWSLPASVVSAIHFHHADPAAIPADAPGRAMAIILQGAGAVAKTLCEAQDPVKSAEICTRAVEAVGLSPAVLAEALPQVESDVEKLAQALRVDVIPNKIFKLIAQQIANNLAAAPVA